MSGIGKYNRKHVLVTALTIALIVMSWSCPTASMSQGSGSPNGIVAAIQGEAEVILEGQEEQKKLQSGDAVQAWNSITTGDKSRLYLKWDNGVETSLGDLSSIFLSPGQTPTGQSDILQIVEGIFRVAAGMSRGPTAPYSVVTPVALIEPASFDQPADFIVEVYDPSTTVLTVLAGDLKVRTFTDEESKEQTVSGCQTVFIDQGKGRLEVLPSSSDDVNRLMGQTTLPGTILAAKDPCEVAAEVQPAPPRPRYAEPTPPPMYVYPSTPEYYVENWDEFDFYPYDEITVLPPRPGVGCVISVPGIGEYIIPLSAFGGWVYDPGVVGVWARRFFLERVVYYDWDYLRDLRARKRHLHHVMYLAQLGRNSALLVQARGELDFLNLRSNWLEARLHRLERRVGGLQAQERQLGPRLPKGLNLNNAIADSFTSAANLPMVNKLQHKLKTDLDMQNKLVNVAGAELSQLRSQLAREKDPQKRLALRNELARFRNDVAEGKLPIAPKQSDLRNLVTQLSKEKDPNSQQKIQNQLLNRLERTEAAGVPEVLDPSKLNALKQDLTKFANPDKRRDLENQVSQLQQSVQVRNEAEANRRQAEELVGQAAKERNPEKQKELIGKLQELSTPLAILGGAAAGAGAMKLLQQRQQHLEQQFTGEKDRERRATLQQSLEELKKRQTDLKKQEQGLKKPQELQRIPGGEIPSRLELKNQEQLELRKKEEEKRTLKLQQFQQERERQLQLRKQQQEEREKGLLQRRLEQEERKKQLQIQQDQQRLKGQQEQDRLRLQKQEQLRLKGQQDQEQLPLKQQEQLRLKGQQDQERLRLQQQDGEKQPELQRLKKQDQEKLLQQRRLEQDQQKKADELKRQQQLKLQQDQSRQQQLKLQQDQSRQQQLKLQQDQSRQQQLKLQQDQSRQQQLKLQQDQSRQQQLKLQQDQSRQQQLRIQQDQAKQQQLRIQQEQARQQQIRQQQEQAKQQQIRIQQQQQQQQEQIRLKKLKEEEEKKLKK